VAFWAGCRRAVLRSGSAANIRGVAGDSGWPMRFTKQSLPLALDLGWLPADRRLLLAIRPLQIKAKSHCTEKERLRNRRKIFSNEKKEDALRS